MSINETKEQILKLPNGCELPGITDGTYGMSFQTDDLKCLARSHTALMGAVVVAIERLYPSEKVRDDILADLLRAVGL